MIGIDLFGLEMKDELAVANEKICKGLYWRGSENIFMDSDGRIKQTKELRILKKKSCPGCEKCGWIFDEISESIACGVASNLLSKIEHGKLYQFRWNTTTEWESGITEIDEIWFEEVEK